MVVFNTVLDPEKKDDYCICCNLPYPDGENYKSVTCKNSELGEMGPGFPLYFELIKKIGWLMLFLTIFYALPSAIMIYLSIEKIKEGLTEEDSKVALFSFGSYVFNSKATEN